jgi:exodeoxyribonuclease-3
VRVATWNVNSLRARVDSVSRWLEEQSPDVLCLQETKVVDADFPEELFAARGYEVAHWGTSQWNGVAIAARTPLSGVVRGLAAGEDEEARVIAASVLGVRVYSVYVPNGRALDDPHYRYKLAWLESLRARVAEEVPRGPLVVAGDFNVAPEDRDVWDPSALEGATHVSTPEREAIARLCSLGLIDGVRALAGDEEAFTWWDYRQGAFRRNLGMRIDLVLVSADLEPRAFVIDRAARGWPKPSDHAPVIVDLDR